MSSSSSINNETTGSNSSLPKETSFDSSSSSSSLQTHMGPRIEMSMKQGLKHGTISLLGFTAASMLANKYWSFYRGFTLPGKIFFVLSGTIATTMISAQDQMTTSYYGHQGALPKGKLIPATWKDWLLLHKYFLVAGTFTTAALAAMIKNARESHLDPTVRAMNVRLFSQGATLIAVVVAIGLSSIKPKLIEAKEIPPK